MVDPLIILGLSTSTPAAQMVNYAIPLTSFAISASTIQVANSSLANPCTTVVDPHSIHQSCIDLNPPTGLGLETFQL
ncbi:UNVERIFIED_CONTAM: hypothetical protein K2H54_039225 [Gekko kuhli]